MINRRISFITKSLIWLLSLIFVVAGLFLAIQGARLVMLDGSWYFLLMGITMLLSGILLFRLNPVGAWIYGVAYILTIVWAIWEVGFDYWPLLSRLAFLGGFAMLVAFAYPSLLKTSSSKTSYFGYKLGFFIAVLLVISIGLGFSKHNTIEANQLPQLNTVNQQDLPTDWKHYANTSMGTRFSGAEQITKDNINQLEVAWTYHTGDIPPFGSAGGEDQNTPLQIDDSLYICTPNNIVISLNADTGKEQWKFNPKSSVPNWQRCRGVGYYKERVINNINGQSTDNELTCHSRILMNTSDGRLMAIDAKTGQLCDDFGDKGVVDLKKNMGEIKPGFYQPTAAPLVADDVVVVGGRVADNYSTGEPGGVIRAYDVHTGQLVWAWDPGNPATKTTPADGKIYTRGTVNVWATMAYDPTLDTIYASTGNATPDFFGAQRTDLDNKYNSSVVALARKTGDIKWTFQTVHHDLWDYDLPSQPLLYDIPDGKGSTIPALIQTAKSGEIFLLNRVTGEAITEVQELAVPQGNVPGEIYSKTQPFSIGMPSIGNETLTESDMWGATPFDQLMCRIDFMSSQYDGLFTPPGMDKTLQYPGSLGGMNWGSVSVDPTTSYIFVNDMRIGLTNWMIPRDQVPTDSSGIEMGIVPQDGTPYGAMRIRFMSPLGIPCQKPPYGTMTAIDLKTQKIVWQVPVGTVMDTGILGIPMKLAMPVGMPTLGGSMTTKTGLLFFAGTQDFYLRAFDSATGKEIWKSRLPVGSQGTPITYISAKTGKQYIVINAGGARQSPERGDYIIGYKLVEK